MSINPVLKPFYRFFKPDTFDHFYTMDPTGEAAPALGYNFEGVAFFAFDQPQEGMTKPLYRWVKDKPLMHYYTTIPDEATAVAAGYRKDSPSYIAGHVLLVNPRGSVRPLKLYRWYAHGHNGAHFYTTDPNGELAPQSGYVQEDIDMGGVYAYEQSRWMSYIDGTKQLTELTIPGTHDSSTYLYEEYGYTKCQAISLTQQLEMGIRFIDIRVKHTSKKRKSEKDDHDDLWLYHGNSFLHETFQLVVDVCKDFLTRHPSECIVMQVKNEAKTFHRDDNFEKSMRKYVAGNPGLFQTDTDERGLFLTDGAFPTLGKARGHVVLIRRFKNGGSAPFGIDLTKWPDNKKFDDTVAGLKKYTIQDVYESYTVGFKSAKFDDHVKPMFDSTPTLTLPYELFMNFTSGTGGVWPRTLATGIESGDNFPGTNVKVLNYLANKPLGRYGIVPMDFPEFPNNGELIRKLVCLNWLVLEQ